MKLHLGSLAILFMLFLSCSEKDISSFLAENNNDQIKLLFNGKYFEGTVYVSQSRFSPSTKAIIRIKIPNQSLYIDYMPILLCDEMIATDKVAKTVYFTISQSYDNYYATDLTYKKPNSFKTLEDNFIRDLVSIPFIDIHNTVNGLDHEQRLQSNNNFQLSHIYGHIWTARRFEIDRMRETRVLDTEITSANAGSRILSSQQLDSFGLKPICYSFNNRGTCMFLFYIDRSLYYENQNLFPMLESLNRPDKLYLNHEQRQLDGLPYIKITDVSEYHRH